VHLGSDPSLQELKLVVVIDSIGGLRRERCRPADLIRQFPYFIGVASKALPNLSVHFSNILQALASRNTAEVLQLEGHTLRISEGVPSVIGGMNLKLA
jgi:hypothetical protein